jgi:hypothetical protein
MLIFDSPDENAETKNFGVEDEKNFENLKLAF